MPVDYGREEYVRLMAAKDTAIQHLVDQGYEFVTNAFRPGAAPKGVRAKDAEMLKARLRQEGYQVEATSAYNETGDILPSMVSIWRKRRAPSTPPRPSRPAE
ncbi:MAG: hypothetical protein V3R47_04500 [candidate division NC10 bacterium]